MYFYLDGSFPADGISGISGGCTVMNALPLAGFWRQLNMLILKTSHFWSDFGSRVGKTPSSEADLRK